MLTMRGLSALLPWLDGLLATSLVLLLSAVSIAYQGGFFKRTRRQAH